MNPWGLLQYAHNMTGAVITGSFVMAATGAFYLLDRRIEDYGRIFLKVGVIGGVVSSILIIFPTGDMHGKYVARNQPAAIAAMEGLFKTETGAGMVLMGQPNDETGQIDNPIVVNDLLSFLIYGTTKAEVERPRPDSPRPMAHRVAVALLRLSHHGRSRNLVCPAHDRRRISALAGTPL